MKPLLKKVLRWKRTFRVLNRTDSLLLYAGAVPRFGSALWHSHPRNHVPHVHVEANPTSHRHHHDHEHHEHSDGSDAHSQHIHHSRDDLHHNDLHDDGHWHFVIPAELLNVSHHLLVFAVCEVWIAIQNLAGRVVGCRTAFSARAPPLLFVLPS